MQARFLMLSPLLRVREFCHAHHGRAFQPSSHFLDSKHKQRAGARLPPLRLLLLACCASLAGLLPLAAAARSGLGAVPRGLPQRYILASASPPMHAQGSGVHARELKSPLGVCKGGCWLRVQRR